MAHRIYEHDKQQGLEQAWHGKTEVIPALTLDDNWLRDWDLVPSPLYDADGAELPWTFLRCSDNPAIIIGQPYNPKTFQPVDNKAFLQMIHDSISGTQHTVASVGSLRNRGRVFVSIKLMGMEEFEAAGRKFSAYLNFGNGHDKSSVLWVNTSNICTVCDNTFTFNLVEVENKATGDDGDDLRIRQRHTKNVALKLPEIAKLVDKAVGVQGEFKAAMDALHKQPLDAKQAKNLFAGFLGRGIEDATKGISTRAANTVNRLGELFATGRGNRGETRADAVSAVTDYYSHESSGRNADPLKQVISSDYGSGNNSKRMFWNLVTDDDKTEEAIRHGGLLLTHTAN